MKWFRVAIALSVCCLIVGGLTFGTIKAVNFIKTTLNKNTIKQEEREEEKITVIESDLTDEAAVIEAEEIIEESNFEEELEEKLVYIGEFKITAYCACEKCCGQWADGYTATMTEATEGRTVAVDPNVIPLGTKLLIRGNMYIAEDTGSAIKENKIDIYVSEHDHCYADWCNGTADVYIIQD